MEKAWPFVAPRAYEDTSKSLNTRTVIFLVLQSCRTVSCVPYLKKKIVVMNMRLYVYLHVVSNVVTGFTYASRVHMICLLDDHPSDDILRAGIILWCFMIVLHIFFKGLLQFLTPANTFNLLCWLLVMLHLSVCIYPTFKELLLAVSGKDTLVQLVFAQHAPAVLLIPRESLLFLGSMLDFMHL